MSSLPRRSPRVLVCAILLAVVALFAAACGESPKDRPNAFPPGSTMHELAEKAKIRVGASPNQPRLAELNLQLDWEGFNIDLAKYLVESLGIDSADIEWVNTTAANRIPFLKQDKIDLFATALAITPERVKTISIAGPYTDASPSLLVRKADATRFTSLDAIPRGTRICVLQGSQGQPRVAKSIPQAEISEFNALTNCVRALEQQSVDAVDSTAPLLAGFAAAKPDELALAPVTYGTGEKWGIGVRKDRADLCQFFNERLQKAFADGVVDRFWREHMGDSGLAAPKAPPAMTSC